MSDKKIIVDNIQFNSSYKNEQITLPHAIEIPEEWQVNEKSILFYILKRLCEEGNKHENKIQKTNSK